jgi:tetratricopeptide (TPR) repeat protein/O-antigen ligase
LYIKEQKTPLAPFFLFIFILFFAPLAFATVELWSLTIVECAIAVVALLVLWFQFKGQIEFVKVPGLLPLFLLIGWMLFQIVPLPPWLLGIISPGSLDVYQPVYRVQGETGWLPISVNQKGTLFEMLRIGSYGLMYIVSVQLLASGRTLEKTVKIVAGLAVFIAFLAILQRYTSPDHIYWFRSGPDARFMGPWINRSQFAGFMAMMLPLLLGLFLYYRPVVDGKESIRSRIVDFFSSTGSNYQLLLGFGIIVVLCAILLSLSRGGIISTILSLVLFYCFLSLKKGFRSWPAIAIFSAGIFLFFTNFGFSELLSRIDDSFTPEGGLNFDRIPAWLDTVEIIKVFWLTGAGFGTFVDIFQVFRTIPGVSVFEHAHNDYLELVTDGGIVGFFLAAWFVVAVIREGWTKIMMRRDTFAILIGIGALVGICSMLLHALTDFNMHNGADGLYFFFLCGLLVSCANTRFQYQRSATLLGKMPITTGACVLVCSIVLLAATLIFPLRSFLAGLMYTEVEGVYLSRQLSQDKLRELSDKVRNICSYDPLEGTYYMVLGEIEKYLGERESASKHYLLAARKNPLRGEFLQKVALMLPESKRKLAVELMELSYQRSLKKDAMMLNFAEWLLWLGDRERAGQVLKEGAAHNPKLLLDDALLMVSSHFSQTETAAILPPNVDTWIAYGEFAEKMGDLEQSMFFRKGALAFIDQEEVKKSGWYSQLYNFYRKQKMEDEAVEVLRQAVVTFPENVGFHISLGDYYQKRGIYYRAREEYEQALIFDPGNKNVLKRLEQLKK